MLSQAANGSTAVVSGVFLGLLLRTIKTREIVAVEWLGLSGLTSIASFFQLLSLRDGFTLSKMLKVIVLGSFSLLVGGSLTIIYADLSGLLPDPR